MKPGSLRKFTILDGMILVAAFAGGFPLQRVAEDAVVRYDTIPRHSFSVHFQTGSPLDRAMEMGFPFLVTLTPAVLAMRLRRPRPPWRSLVCQPGMVASCAAILPIAWLLAGLRNMVSDLAELEAYLPASLYANVTKGYFIALPPLGEIFLAYGHTVGLWVLVAWLTLILSGRSRAEPSWIDRLGCVVGAAWIAVMLARFVAG